LRILLVEDNQHLSEAISESLATAGFESDPVPDGEAALAAAAGQQYDAVVLDLGLPDVDGMEVLRKLRARKDMVPVLILTARDALSDRVEGLNKGADDYLVKPFETEELIARLKALLRRPARALDAVLTLSNLSFDTISREAAVGAARLGLSRRETDLLEQLIRASDRIVTKKAIESRLYSYDEKGSVNSVEVLVHRLRKKLQAQDAGIEIHTLRGIGYMMTGSKEC
jgi:DNA-binding response OmpR family regulator